MQLGTPAKCYGDRSHDVEGLARLCLARSAVDAQGSSICNVDARLQVELPSVGIQHRVGLLNQNTQHVITI